MKVREIVRTLVGGCVVYVLMAACAGSEGAGRGGGNGSGGASGGGVTDPVAGAQAGEPTVVTEKCTKQGELDGMPILYAEHAFPGRSLDELAGVHVYAHLLQSNRVVPGYEYSVSAPQLAEGKVAVFCGYANAPGLDSVTFVLP